MRRDTISNTSIVVITAMRIILSRLRFESPQRISSFKVLCCHHSNHQRSSTLDLCSTLHKHHSRVHAPFIIFPPPNPNPPVRARFTQRDYTHKHTLAKTHTTHFSLLLSQTRLITHRNTNTSARARAHTQNNARTPLSYPLVHV